MTVSPLILQITDAGLAAIVAAEAAGTASVVIAEVGLTNSVFTAAPTLTALPGEFKRLTAVSGEVAAPNIIHVVGYDTSSDAYTVRGMGLYLNDGTLFATYGNADPVLNKVALAFGLITFDVAFSSDVGASIAFTGALFNNPPATTEMRGVVELATLAEAAAGVDALRALTPQGAKAAILGWLLTQDGSGSGLDADLLDGQHGAYYADIAARLGFTPVNKAGDTLTGALSLVAGAPSAPAHATRKDYVDGAVAAITAASILSKLITVDGSGSGLDADLLDGQHASAFALANGFSFVSNANGIGIGITIGAITVWLMAGTAPLTNSATTNVTYPVATLTTAAFPSPAAMSAIDTADVRNGGLVPGTATLTGFQIYASNWSVSNTGGPMPWLAIGY